MGNNNNLPTREQLGAQIFSQVEFLLEDGRSQSLTQDQYLSLAVTALKGAGANRELLHRVVGELYQQLLETQY